MNRNILSNILMFAVGAAIGSVVTWKLVDKKYAQIAQEEIDSIRDFYADRDDEKTEGEDSEEDDEDYDNERKYVRLVKNEGYAGEEDAKVMKKEPYVVSYEEFAEIGYETEVLYYFTDGVVTDTMYNVIEDAEAMIGPNIETHFGEEEEDVVYVRNDRMRLDIEVQRDLRAYADLQED